jgi:ketosteroid isomerase-like protein
MSQTSNPFNTMLTEYCASIFDKNADNYLSLYSNDVLIFDMWNDWYVRGLKQWRELTENWFASLNTEKVIVTATEIQLNQSADIIVGCAILRFAAISEEGLELRYLHNRVSITMHNVDGKWKIFHQHSSAPIDGKSINVMFHMDNWDQSKATS